MPTRDSRAEAEAEAEKALRRLRRASVYKFVKEEIPKFRAILESLARREYEAGYAAAIAEALREYEAQARRRG